jgi:hypothetical protein
VILKGKDKQGMLAHTCNSSTQEAEEGGTQIQGQPRLTWTTQLYNLSQNKQMKENTAK